jgi:hypothetical protein
MFFVVVLVSFFASSEGRIDQKIDSNLITCDVCNYLMDGLYHEANLQRKSAPYQKLDEGSVQDLVSTICNSNKKEGEWMRRLDIVHKKTDGGVILELVQPGGISKCNEECKTIGKACEALLDDDIDPDDLAVLIWRNKVSLKDAKVTLLHSISQIIHGLHRKKFVPRDVIRRRRLFLIQELMRSFM